MIRRAKAEQVRVWAHQTRPALRCRLLRGSALTMSLLAIALSASVERAYANPEGGTVVVGDATISPIDDSTLEVDQGSDRVVIDWTSFSIDEGETVNFVQPDSSSIALNRVTGFEQSFINGVLTANGYIFLVNPNGIIFGASAFVDVGGLVASTADISNDDFMAGNFDFNIASPNDTAAIINEGMITVADTGLAALVAPTVRNTGIIVANLGTVGLAGARTFTLDFYGDGLFSFDTGSEVVAAPTDGGALVENTGTITANGGSILVTALAAEDVINNVINLDGVIEANSVGMQNGTIVLSGGDNGGVLVTGEISASGDDAGETGGSVTILGEDITLGAGAYVSASGDAGGGEVRIGGDFQGGGELAHAQNVTVEVDARIEADAITTGDGGTVILWADGTTTYEGAISARGGAESGDGGFVEVSGKEETIFLSAVDLGASNGEAGSLLIDPTDFTVTAGVSAALEGTLDTGGSIYIDADNDVFVTNSIDGASSTVSGGGINISSGRSTSISAGVTISTNNGAISVFVNDDERSAANRAAGDATFINNGTIDSNGGTIIIGNGSLSPGAVGAFELGSIYSDGGVIAVDNSVDDIIISTGTLDGGGGNISVTAAGTITVGDGAGAAIDASLGGSVSLDAGSDIVDGGGVIDMSGGGVLTLDAGGGVGASGAAIDTSGTSNLFGSAGNGGFFVANTGGNTMTVGNVFATAAGSATGDIEISNSDANLMIGGILSTDGTMLLDAGSGDFSISGSASAVASGTLTVEADTVAISGALSGGDIVLRPASGATTIGIGTGATGTFNLTNAELDFLGTSGTVTIGSATSGDVDIDSVALADSGFNLTVLGDDFTFDDADTALTLAQGATVLLDAAGTITGGGTSTDILFGSATGSIGFESGGDVTLDTFGSLVAGTASGSIDLENTGNLTIGTVAGYSGLNAGSGSVAVTVHSDLSVTSAISASTDVTLDASSGTFSMTAAVTSGGTATVIADTVYIGATLTGADINLHAATAGTSIGLNNATGIFNLTAAELQNLESTGTVSIGTTASGNIGIGGLGATDLSGENFDLNLAGDALTVSDGNTGLTLNADSSLSLDLSGSLTGGGTMTDFAWAGGTSNGTFDFSAVGNVNVSTSAVSTLDGTTSGAITYANTGPGQLNINSLVSTGGAVDVTNTGNVVVETGTLQSGGDITLDVTGDITIGDGAGTAIDADGGAYDVTLTASGNILDGGGSVAMGGGTLTFDAGGGVGTSADHIDTSGVTGLVADAAAGGVYIDNSGSPTVIVHGATAVAGGGDPGNIEITNSNWDIEVDGAVNAGGSVLFDAGSGAFSNSGSGSITAGADVVVTADTVAIGATISGDDITLQPYTLSQTLGLSNASGGFNLTNAEFDLLNTTGTVTVGAASGSGSITIGGSGTLALADNAFDLVIRGGDLTFDDSVTAMTLREGGRLTLDVGAITGGGTMLDIDFAGSSSGGLVFSAGGAVDLVTDGLGRLTGTATGSIALDNTGALSINHLEAGGTIDLDNVGDTTVETGTLIAGGDVVLTITGTLTVGDASGVAIDASGGVYDIILDVSEDIVDADGIIDMSGGGTLTMDAGGTVGAAGSAIETSSTANLTGSAGDGSFFVHNIGGTTVTVTGISATASGSATGDIDIANVDADIGVTGAVTADGGINFDAGTGEFSNTGAGAVTAGRRVEVTADTIALAAVISGEEILLHPRTDSQTIGLNDAQGLFNLSEAELQLLDTTGWVVIGSDTGTGDVFIASSGTIDLSGETYDLGIQGGDMTFDDGQTAVMMSAGSVFGMIADNIFGGGTEFDVTFPGGGTPDGAFVFLADGTVDLRLSAGTLAGIATGDIDIYNSGDLTIGEFFVDPDDSGTITGLASSGSINLTVASDLDVIEAITATDEIEIDAGTGAFTNSGDGTVTSADSGVDITADTVNIGAAISAVNGWIWLDTGSAGRTIGLGSASGDFNLTDAEFALLDTNELTVGNSASGTITIGDVETVDLTVEGYNLTILSGGEVQFNDARTGLALAEDTFLFLDVGSITGGGAMPDVTFASATGALAFAADGDVTLNTQASLMGGDATGDITIENTGDLEIGNLGDFSGLDSGGTISLEVHSDLTISQAVTATGNVTLDANAGTFSNTGSGSVSAGGDVLVEADTVALGAAITGANLTLRPNSDAQTIGLNDASGVFNLSNAELDHLASTGMLTIGRVSGTGGVSIGGLGTADLSDETFDLTLYGGALTFADNDPALKLHQSSTAIIDVASITGGGSFTDVEFGGGDGALAIDTIGNARFSMDGSTLSGMVGGSLEGTNVGDLTIGAVGGYTGMTVGSWTRFDATGGSLTIAEDFAAGGDTTLRAFGDLTFDGGDLDADGGAYVVALVSDTGMITSTGNAVLMSDGELWLDAKTGVNLDTHGSGTATFTLAGETDTGDLKIDNRVGGNVLVGSVTGFGSGLTVIAAPGAGGGDLRLTNFGHGGTIEVDADVTGSGDVGIGADGAVTLNAGATVDASRGGQLGIGSLSATVTIDGVIDATGPGNAMIFGFLGIDGSGKVLMGSNGLALRSIAGDIDVNTQGTDGETFLLAAAAESSGDITVTNTGSGNILLDEVSIVSLAGTSVSGTVSDVTTPNGDIRLQNSALGAGNGDLIVSSGFEVGAGAVTASGNVTLISDTATITVSSSATISGAVSVSFSAALDIAIGDNAKILSGGPLGMTAGGTITTGVMSALRSMGDTLLDAGDDIIIGAGGMVGSGADLTMTAGGTITTGDGSSVAAAGDVLLDAGEDIIIGNSAFLSAGGTMGGTASGGGLIAQKLDVSTNGHVTLSTTNGGISVGTGTTVSGTASVNFSAATDIDVGDYADVVSGGPLAMTAGGTIIAGDGSSLFAGTGMALQAGDNISIGSSATVASGGALSLDSGGTIAAGTSSTLTGATLVLFAADDDITIAAGAFVGSPKDVSLVAGGNIATAAGSTVRGGETILFDAGADISTSGTTDASAAGVAVTLLAGGTITDAGNTYIFTDGTLRAEAGGDIDVTLSGTTGSTITAALSAGGNVDLFLRDGGDLTIDEVTSGGGTTTGVTAANGYVDIDLEDGLLTINENITATHASGFDVMLSADDMQISSTVSASGDIYIDPYTDGRGIALNDPTTATLSLTNAEVAFLDTPNKVEFGRAGTGDIYIGGSGSLDLTTTNWANVRFLTDAVIFVTAGVESEDVGNLFDGDVVLTGATTIDTVNGGTGGEVRVTGTIEGTASGAQTLTITSGVGDIDFEQAAGQVTPLGTLALSGHDITVTDIATVGTQTYVATGEVAFGSSYTTGGFAFGLTGGLTLDDDVLIDTSVGAGTGADITIDDITGDGHTLGLDAGNDGGILVGSWTNTDAFAGMGTLTIIDSDTTTVTGAANGDRLEVVDTTTSVSLLGDVDLNSLLFGAAPYRVIITGSNVFLVNQVVFDNTGTTTLGDSAGDVFVFTGGVDATNGGTIVSGNFTFGGTGLVATSLSLSGDASFNTAGGSMLLGTVYGNGNTFTLDAGNTGNINIGSLTNAAGTGALHVINADEVVITGAVTADTVDFDTAQTSVTLLGMLTANNLFVGAGTYVFSLYGGALVTNFVDFLNSGGVNIGDEDTDESLFLSGLDTTASDTTAAGLIQSEGGSITFGNLLLGADTTVDSTLNTSAGANINFNGWIDSWPATAFDLSVIAGNASTATFTGNVGDVDPLGSLQVSALEIILHDVSTVGVQIYEALDALGGLGRVQLNSTYQTQGADFTLVGDVDIADHATVDTTWNGAYTMGDIFFGGAGGAIAFELDTGTLNLISGGSTLVNALFAGSLSESNSVGIWARDNIGLAGGTLGNDLTLHAGGFDGELNANPGGDIVINGPTTIGDFTDITASGDVTFLAEFNTYALRIRLNGLAQSFGFSPVNIEEDFDIGGLTEGMGTSKLWGTIRSNDSDQAAALGNQIELERRDEFLFNDCIVEVGCLNFDSSTLEIPVFDPVIYLYERDGTVNELRYSDLPNTEIWYGLGGAPDIWDDRLGSSDDDEDTNGHSNGGEE